jgi:hypothetical protein
MRKQWRVFGCLTGAIGFCWLGGHAMGQAAPEAAQCAQYIQYPQGAPPVMPAELGAANAGGRSAGESPADLRILLIGPA